jgi:DNA-binding SARP family transcriptional activator
VAVFVGVLGPVAVQIDGTTTAVGRPQVRQLLALLAAAGGRSVDASSIEEDLWPEDPPRSPRSALHVIVNRAREILGPTGREVLVSTSDGYRLDGAICTVDLTDWEHDLAAAQRAARMGDLDAALDRYRRAGDRWRGEPFADVEGSIRLDQERRALEIARADAGVAELDLLVRAGRYHEAASMAPALLDRDPLREDLVVVALAALDGSQRRADALRVAARFRSDLRDELGLSPSPRFDEAELQVLGGTPRSGRTRTVQPAATVHRSLRGREGERRILDAEVEGGLRGAGAVVVLAGEPGIGVSTFLRDLAARWTSRDQAPVDLVDPAEGAHSLRGALGLGAPRPAEGQRGEHQRARSRLADDVGEGGRLIVLDDAHLLDEWSRSFLLSLAAAPLPHVVVVVGLADDPAGSDGSQLLDALTADGVVVRIAPLDAAALDEVVSDRWPDLPPATVRRWAELLERWCGGNPMWVHEVLEDLDPTVDPGELDVVPSSVETTVRRRMAQLPPRARDLLRTAAVLGPEVDLRVLAAVAEQPIDAVVSTLSQTVAVDALVPSDRPGRWRFRHELVQRAIASSVGPGEAATWHAAAGLHLRTLRGHRHEAARHLVRAVPLVSAEEAYLASSAAAAELLAQGAYAESADLYREAAALAPGGDEQRRAWLGEAAAAEQMGDRLRAARRYDEVMAACADGRSPDLLAEAALGSTSHASAVGGRNDRRSRLRMAWRRLDRSHPRFDSVAVELALEQVNARQDLEPELLDHVRSVAGDPSSAAHLLARRFCLADDEIDGAAGIDDAARLAAEVIVPGRAPAFVASACLAVSIGVAFAAGSWARAEEWIDEMVLLGATSGEPRAQWQSLAFRAVLLDASGETAAADRVAEDARSLGERLDMGDAAATFALYQFGQVYRAGSLAVLAPVLAAAEDRYRFPVWSILRGLAELDAGNEADATTLLRAGLLPGIAERYHFRAATIATGALLAARLGDDTGLDAAGPHLDRASGRFVMLGYGGPCLGPVDWYRAEVARAAGRGDDADRLLESAIERCRTVGAHAWVTALQP